MEQHTLLKWQRYGPWQNTVDSHKQATSMHDTGPLPAYLCQLRYSKHRILNAVACFVGVGDLAEREGQRGGQRGRREVRMRERHPIEACCRLEQGVLGTGGMEHAKQQPI